LGVRTLQLFRHVVDLVGGVLTVLRRNWIEKRKIKKKEGEGLTAKRALEERVLTQYLFQRRERSWLSRVDLK